jgi:hypothetical protein
VCAPPDEEFAGLIALVGVPLRPPVRSVVVSDLRSELMK